MEISPRLIVYLLAFCFLALALSTSSFAMLGSENLSGKTSEKVRQREGRLLTEQKEGASEVTGNDASDDSSDVLRSNEVAHIAESNFTGDRAGGSVPEISVEELKIREQLRTLLTKKSAKEVKAILQDLSTREQAQGHVDSPLKSSAVDDAFIENLLKQSDDEILSQLRNPCIATKFFDRLKQCQRQMDFFSGPNDEEEKRDFKEENHDIMYRELECFLIALEGHMREAHEGEGQNDAVFLEDIKLAECFYAFCKREEGFIKEALGLSVIPSTQKEFRQGLESLTPEWKAAFCAYPSIFLCGIKDSKEKEFLKAKVNSECIPNEALQLLLEKRANFFLHKARNSSNRGMAEFDIESCNEDLTEKINNIDLEIAAHRNYARYQEELGKLNDSESQQSLTSVQVAQRSILEMANEGGKRLIDILSSKKTEEFSSKQNEPVKGNVLSLHNLKSYQKENSYSLASIENFFKRQELLQGQSQVTRKTIQKEYQDFFNNKIETALYLLTKGSTIQTLYHRRTACFVDALSGLYDDQTSVLDSIREPLIKAYQKLIILTEFIPGSFFDAPLLPLFMQEKFVSLLDQAAQACYRGRNSALDSLLKIIEKYRDLLVIEKQVPLTALSKLKKDSQWMILQAEASAVWHQVEADQSIQDLEIATLPWNFEHSFEKNLNSLQTRLLAGETMGNLKKDQLTNFESGLTAASSQGEQPSTGRRTSCFTPESTLSRENNQQLDGKVLFKLSCQQLGKLQGELERMTPEDWHQNDPLLELIRENNEKISDRRSDKTELLKEMRQAAFLFPYVQKKAELTKMLMRVKANGTYGDCQGKVSHLWDSMHRKWKEVMSCLEHLAVSRLMFEQEITQKNDPYLTNALDEVREKQEREFKELLAVAETASPFPQQVNSSVIRGTLPLRDRQRIGHSLACGGLVGIFMLFAFLLHSSATSY